jgi:hypothetical protein
MKPRRRVVVESVRGWVWDGFWFIFILVPRDGE